MLGVTDDFLTRAEGGVETYRLYQEREDELTLYYSGLAGFEAGPLKAQLERLFGHPLRLNLRWQATLPDPGGYKRQLLVSLIA